MIFLLMAGIALAPEKVEIEAGEPVVIRGTATLPSGTTLKAPEQGLLQDSPFSIIELNLSPEGGIAMTVAAFDTGDLTFPALDWGGVKSPPVKFKVTAPAGDQPGADIKELRGPVVGVNVFPWFLGLVAALALAAWYFWKRRAKPEPERPEVAPLTAYEEAMARLTRLVDSGQWERGEAKSFYIELAEILRDYLEVRYDIEVKSLTTNALTRRLRELELDVALTRDARDFLNDCDLVKFAKWRPHDSEKERDVQRLRRLLEATHSGVESLPS